MPKPCRRCGAPKPPGPGRQLCGNCPPINPNSAGIPIPCRACGEPRRHKQGALYCAECAELRAAAAVIRSNARKAIAKRKPCRGCNAAGPFHTPAGTPSPYCSACQAERKQPPKCQRCESRPVRAHRAHLCLPCTEDAKRAASAYKREWEKRHPDALLRHRRKNANPSRAEYLRMQRRLNLEQAGETIEAKVVSLRPAHRNFPELPAAPLAKAINKVIERERRSTFALGPKVSGEDQDSTRAMVCERIGITARTLYAWEAGERQSVRFDVADKVITRSDVLWFDVYGDDPVAAWAFTGEKAA